MRIQIYGASGRVGTRLVEAILQNPGFELSAALVSPESKLIGSPVAGGSIEYRSAETEIKNRCDVIIDFTNPEATLRLQKMLGERAVPVVIGTTGFTADQRETLQSWGRYRPLLIGANFALGFEAFQQSVMQFAQMMSGAEPTVVETYHARKKMAASGTSETLAEKLRHVRSKATGFDVGKPEIVVHREGDVVGINQVRFDFGSGETSFTYVVHTLQAYAEGALAAARWLVDRQPEAGCYDVTDSLGKEG